VVVVTSNLNGQADTSARTWIPEEARAAGGGWFFVRVSRLAAQNEIGCLFCRTVTGPA